MQLSQEATFTADANPASLRSWIITAVLALFIIPQGGHAQSALSHYVWQGSGVYQAFSRTSKIITGPVQLVEDGGSLTLHFGEKGSSHLSSEGMFYREWGMDLSGKQVTAEVFRIDRDPGKLLNGNTLCGDTKARYLVFHDELFLDTHLLNLAVFDSESPPYDIQSEGLCGTFNYSVE